MSTRSKFVCVTAAAVIVLGAAVSAFALRSGGEADPGGAVSTTQSGPQKSWTPDEVKQAQENMRNQKGPGGY